MPVPCEDLFELLNELERSEYAKAVEEAQKPEIERTFAAAIQCVKPVYESFVPYARRSEPPQNV